MVAENLFFPREDILIKAKRICKGEVIFLADLFSLFYNTYCDLLPVLIS
jgi:hypothetical protein